MAPVEAVPYRAVPDNIREPEGLYPALLVSVPLTGSYCIPTKVASTVKLLPLVVTANTVSRSVPKAMPPDKITPASGLAPSLLVKLWRFVKPSPLVWMANTVPAPEPPPQNAVPYSVVLDKVKPAAGLAPSLLVLLSSAVNVCRTLKP